MIFAYPHLLLLFLIIPILIIFFIVYFYKKKKSLSMFGDSILLNKLISTSFTKQKIKIGLIISSFLFLILTLSRPQFGMKMVEIKQESADIIIAVDVSSSMLAQDIKPNRMEKAKTVLSQLVQGLNGNRVGIIAFAGTAFWQCPLTLDISSVNIFLQIMDANLIPLPGTKIGNAIKLATQALSKSSPKTKAIILLTDGEDHKSDPVAIAKEAAKYGIKIFTIGFGNPQGEPIPELDNQGNLLGYKKNKKGEIVMSKLDESMLREISYQTGGEYFWAPDGNVDISYIINLLQGLDKQKVSSKMNRQYEDRYQYPLFIALLCLIIEFLIPETKSNRNLID